MIDEKQFADLMDLARHNNITICQEIEKKRYVLRGRGNNIAEFLRTTGVSAIVIDSEEWQPQDVILQINKPSIIKLAFQELIFN